MGELGDTSFLEEVGEEMSHELERLIAQGFSDATDPYGRPWAPRKKPYPWAPLDKTGDTKGSFHVEHSASGIAVQNPVLYSPFLHYGTRFMDARAMLPVDDDLGDWEAPLTAAAQRVFNRHIND